MRSYYALTRAMTPSRFAWAGTSGAPSRLIAINELWQEVQTNADNLLVFRVRSEQQPGEYIGKDDEIEWCAGLIDASTRWRIAGNMVRIGLSSLRALTLQQACMNAFGMVISKHQAVITSTERHGAALAIQGQIVEAEKGATTRQSLYEIEIAKATINFVLASDEHEAIGSLPALAPLMWNVPSVAQEPETSGPGKIRRASVLAMASSMLLGEAWARLNERLPEWLYSPMPTLGKPQEAAPAPPEAPGEEEEQREDSLHEGSTT